MSTGTATQSALDAITRVLAKELGSRKIRVNSINPGATATEGARAAGVMGAGSDFEKLSRWSQGSKVKNRTQAGEVEQVTSPPEPLT